MALKKLQQPLIHHAPPVGRSISERKIVLLLRPEERKRLQVCEKTIREGLGTFVSVGTALMEIRDARLYRQTHSTFEAYVQSVLALTRPRAYQLIDSAQVVNDLSAIVDIPLPQNEGQARELRRWRTPEERVEKWKAVLDAVGDQPLTAKFIRQTLLPASRNTSTPDKTKACLDQLRRLAADSPAEARALKLISKLEEILSSVTDEAPAPVAPKENLWLPGFGL